MSPLDHKLLRDLWRMKGQGLAIGMVIAMGVMVQVMMSGLVTSLEQTRDAYYERYRLADVFAPLVRAPAHMLDRIAEVPGVTTVEGRISGAALVDIEGLDLGVPARVLSLPERRQTRLNDVLLNAGRLLDADHPDEVLLLESFARAHGLEPGDPLKVTLNGARRVFTISGLAQSPEFLYSAAPGELVANDARYAVIWMLQSPMAAAYDMQGAFNEALLGLSRDANEAAVIDAVDRLMDRFGGLGAFALSDQNSNRFVTEEINGLKASSTSVPPIFLAVAAFLLNIVIGRMVQTEREEIGLLKAFGYTNTEVSLHYFKFVVTIAASGAALGCLLGIAMGRAMIDLYTIYYKFPFIVFRLDPPSFITGFAVSVLAASAASLFVLRRVYALAPAEAMRPPAPADFSKSWRIGARLNRLLDQPTRMVLRRLLRQPVRMAGSVIGIAAGLGLSVSMLTIYVGFDATLEASFSYMDRSDLTVTFTHAASDKTVLELGRMRGVDHVQPVRQVAAVLSSGRLVHKGAVTGLPGDAALFRAIGAELEQIDLPPSGLVLSTGIADKLDVTVGDRVRVEIREGARPVVELPVTRVAESYMGSPVFMDIDALNRAVGTPDRVSGAYLLIDEAQAARIYRALKAMPVVAGVSRKEESRAAFQDLMDNGAGAMRFVNLLIAFIITFGIVYNAARIAYAERALDLASLRVLGFSNGEVSFVLLGELAVATLLALPVGAVIGYYLSFLISATFSTDLYQIPAIFEPSVYGVGVCVVLAAAFVSGWLVNRDMQRIDLVTALKTKE